MRSCFYIDFKWLWLKPFIFLLILGGMFQCTPSENKEDQQIRELLMTWNRLLLDLERFTPGYHAPSSARMFAYISMAAYEASLPGNSGYASLEQKIAPGYTPLKWENQQQQFCVLASINAAYRTITPLFFPNAPKELKAQINTTAELFVFQHKQQDCSASTLFGQKTAAAVWQYALLDGKETHGGSDCPFQNYAIKTIDSTFQLDQDHPVAPLVPYWGCIRPLVVAIKDITPIPPPIFSEKVNSAIHTQAMEVFSASQPLSKENQWIAEFWSDDVAGLTVTPSGRWISIATQAIEQQCPSWPFTLETYLRTSIALNDALIICWYLKYNYNLERPQTYISRVIHPDWQSYMDAPPFPAYPAGHAMLSAAAAEALTGLFGDPFTLCDATHKGRKEFAGMPRTFPSFRAMASENSFSRLLTGVHFRIDCEEGMRLGTEIGKKVANLQISSN
jgi:hypothetical protein